MSLFLIAGLGNPGPRYAKNRHNVGYQFLDYVAITCGLSFARQQFRALIAEGQIAGQRALLAKPLTFMNLSGHAVRSLMSFYKIEPANLLVVYDDLDLPQGVARMRPQGGSGGHKGMQSIIEQIGTQEFARLRIGIGRPEAGDPADYVLHNLTADEAIHRDQTFERARQALTTWMCNGIDLAMNGLNQTPVSEGKSD